MSTRRAIFKLLGAAPAAIVGVKGEIASLLASPAAAAAMALAATTSQTLAQPAGIGGGIIGKQVARLRRMFQDESYAKQRVRIGGTLDPDIAALRSVSMVNKARTQAERDIADCILNQQIDRVFYGD